MRLFGSASRGLCICIGLGGDVCRAVVSQNSGVGAYVGMCAVCGYYRGRG